MIITPFPETPESVLSGLEPFFRSLGFSMVVRTDPDHHDGMIAFTSQLCHLISSAYVREPLVRDHVGYSAGSFRDMARVGAPDPDTWTELFFANRDALLPILERYINRLDDFRDALAAEDRARLHAALEDGVAAKAQFGKGLK
jgi:prephenate dehydrogenase